MSELEKSKIEQYSEICKVGIYGVTKEELQQHMKKGGKLKWIINPTNWSITVWPNRNDMIVYHEDIDKDGYAADLYGYVSPKGDVNFTMNNSEKKSTIPRESIKLAIQKFLNS